MADQNGAAAAFGAAPQQPGGVSADSTLQAFSASPGQVPNLL